MEKTFSLQGETVRLLPTTAALWHAFYKKYEPDPLMDTAPYKYDYPAYERAYHIRMADKTRLYFSILHQGEVIGDIYLKHIDNEKKTAEFGIALINDSVKGKGFGTEAVALLVKYTQAILGLESISANTVLRNSRSQHVLEKLGFVYTHADSDFKYYVLRNKSVN